MEKLTKKDAEEYYDDIEIIDAFLYGIEISGDNADVYKLRQKIFKIKRYFLKYL